MPQDTYKLQVSLAHMHSRNTACTNVWGYIGQPTTWLDAAVGAKWTCIGLGEEVCYYISIASTNRWSYQAA